MAALRAPDPGARCARLVSPDGIEQVPVSTGTCSRVKTPFPREAAPVDFGRGSRPVPTRDAVASREVPAAAATPKSDRPFGLGWKARRGGGPAARRCAASPSRPLLAGTGFRAQRSPRGNGVLTLITEKYADWDRALRPSVPLPPPGSCD